MLCKLQKRNIDVVNEICKLLDEYRPNKNFMQNSYTDLVTFVDARPGHDFRYALDTSKIRDELDGDLPIPLNTV